MINFQDMYLRDFFLHIKSNFSSNTNSYLGYTRKVELHGIIQTVLSHNMGVV